MRAKEERKSTFFEDKGQVEYMLQFLLDAFCSTLFTKRKSRDSRRPRGAEFRVFQIRPFLQAPMDGQVLEDFTMPKAKSIVFLIYSVALVHHSKAIHTLLRKLYYLT